MLTILEKPQGTVVLVESPALTTENADKFGANLIKVVCNRSSRVVVLDLQNVGLIGECGLNVLVREHGRLGKTGGTLRLCGVNGQVQEKLATTQVDRLIEIYPDESAALAADFIKEAP